MRARSKKKRRYAIRRGRVYRGDGSETNARRGLSGGETETNARRSFSGGEAVRKGRCPLNPAPPGALAGAWPPGEPTNNLGTNQAATPNANSNLRRFEWRRSGAQGARQGPGLLASLTIT